MTIKNFYPENTKDKLYIEAGYGVSLLDILNKVQSHFELNEEDFNLVSAYSELLDNFTVTAEYIHTHCITYDRYDPGDYTNFIVVERIKR